MNAVLPDRAPRASWPDGGSLSRSIQLKLYTSTGIQSRSGGDLDVLGIAWQYRWGAVFEPYIRERNGQRVTTNSEMEGDAMDEDTRKGKVGPSRAALMCTFCIAPAIIPSWPYASQGSDAKSILKAMSDYVASQKTIEVTFDSDIEVITPQLELETRGWKVADDFFEKDIQGSSEIKERGV